MEVDEVEKTGRDNASDDVPPGQSQASSAVGKIEYRMRTNGGRGEPQQTQQTSRNCWLPIGSMYYRVRGYPIC